jgi:hypothetical protein
MLKHIGIAFSGMLLAGAAIAQTTTTPPPPASSPPQGSGSAPMGPPAGAGKDAPSVPGTSTAPGNPNETQRRLDTPGQGGASGGGSGGSGR